MQILSKVSSAVAVNLSVIPPDCNPDGDKAEEAQPGKQPCCHRCRNSYIEHPETDKKRQEQHCHSNEIQIFIIGRRVLKFLTNHSTFIWKKLLLYCINALCIFQSSGLEGDRNREKRGFLFKTHCRKSNLEILCLRQRFL